MPTDWALGASDVKPVVHLYALNWNERPLLPYFLAHYRPFVDHFYIFDDGSDDASLEFLAEQPDVTLGCFVRDGDSYIEPAREFYDTIWRASRGEADWVIVVNVDEFLHHPAPALALRQLTDEGVTAVRAVGWEMVSDRFPETGAMTEAAPLGVRRPVMDKVALFDPMAVETIGYGAGRHAASPTGEVRWPRRIKFDLLHYKRLGLEYVRRRHAELGPRRGTKDLASGWGRHYDKDDERLAAEQQRLEGGARPVTVESAIQLGHTRELLPGCLLVRLKDVRNDRGGLRELWTEGEAWARDTRHVYLTTTNPGAIKAWYRHKRQADRVSAVSGSVRFVLYDTRGPEAPAGPVTVELRAEEPFLLVVPPGVWHGFQGLGAEPCSLLHLNSATYDWLSTDEERLAVDTPEIPYAWTP